MNLDAVQADAAGVLAQAEIALILKKMTALETKLSDLEGERIRLRERSRRTAEPAAAV